MCILGVLGLYFGKIKTLIWHVILQYPGGKHYSNRAVGLENGMMELSQVCCPL